MDGSAVKEFAERFQHPETIDGLIARPKDWVLEDPAALVKAGPQPEALAVYTLGAVRDYVRENRDNLDLEKIVVHVVSPQIVTVNGPLQDRARSRETYLKATASNMTDNFIGKFMSIEEFIIGLQSRFVLSDERVALLRLFSNVKQEAVKVSSDDGFSQTVTAKAGIAVVNEAQVPNPVELVPFRTFREVTQPASSFVLRLQSKGQGYAPEVGLFEADGGAWRLVAVDRVRDWLAEALEGVDVAVLA